MKRHFKTLAMVMTCMAMVLCVSCKKDDNNEPDGGITGGDGFIFDHAYVDLGLPSHTLWATCNVGAMTPYDYGYHLAWGESSTKDRYLWYNYVFYDALERRLTKYNTDSIYGIVDNKTVLDPEDDAAHVKWGGNWRMPTFAEILELREECTWKWTLYPLGIGYRVTGPNGKSIFLPAAGSYHEFDYLYAGSMGDYWSSSMFVDEEWGAPSGDDEPSSYVIRNPENACFLRINSYGVEIVLGDRTYGQSVRPVCSPQ